MSLYSATHNGQEFFLGRIPSVYDRRNLLMEDVLEVKQQPKTKIWTPGVNLDQGQTPSCVGHAGRGWELCTPVADAQDNAEGSVPDPRATEIWSAAQIIEFGHADPNDGATIHGMAKALHDPKGTLAVNGKARMKSYVWAKKLDTALYYVSYKGPLVIGISWYNNMFTPNSDGVVTVDASSGLAGGHAILIYGIDMEKKLVGPIRNSWTVTWGKQGDFYLPFADAQTLLFDDNGEVCSGVEQVVDQSV